MERAPELVKLISKSWPKYLRELAANDRKHGFEDPPLDAKIFMFANRSIEAIRQAQPAIRDLPDSYFLGIVAAGVVVSGTHTLGDVEKAMGFAVPQQLIE